MEINLADIKDIATIAKPFIDPLINAIITPKVKALEHWLKRKKTEDDVFDNFYENKFSDYLVRSYQKFSSLNILVFPNQQVNIKSIYQPLTIRSTKDYSNYRIDVFKKEYIEPYKRILISDTAGMGKSTLMKWIGISLIETNISIPILIELKRLNEKHSVLDEIYNQINPIDKSFDKDLILKFLELGQFTILLDGFDEIIYEQREKVILDLKDFISKTINNWFILTSRPDSSLTSFGDFQMFHIKPLEIKESFALIKKYDALNVNKVSDQLISNIQSKHPQVNEFLINPFLVSLLYKTYTYNRDIPSKKSTFYEEVYGALYKHHDLSKDGFKRNKKSGLDLQDFRLVLRQLAFDTSKIVQVEYNEQELIRYVKEAKSKCAGLDFKELGFIEDIELNVPLFVRDGSVLKWAHKSLQDYFSAEFISSSKDKEKIIELIYKSEKDNYLNILDFLYELEYKAFRKIIIKDVLKEFIKYCDTSFKKFEGFKKSHIRERQAIAFGVTYGFYLCDKDELDFRDIEKRFKSKIKIPIRRIMSRKYRMDKTLFQIFGTNFKQEIINIIGIRNENIFITRSLEQRVLDEEMIQSFPKDTPICLDEDPQNQMNSKRNFNLFNKIALTERFSRRTSDKFFLLDFTKCKNLLSRLNKEEQYDEQKDILRGI